MSLTETVLKMRFIILFVLSICAIHGFSQSNHAMPPGNSKPFVLGEIDELPSKFLNEKRILNIYLPDEYNTRDTTTYPVVYFLDGGADEDFVHIVGLYQFNSFPWINRVPKSIVVGIANTDRKKDFTYPTTLDADKKLYPASGHSDQFIRFLQQELQPYIKKKFRTNASRTLIGESLGGLLAAEILLKQPTLFNQYIIVSPVCGGTMVLC